MSTDNSQSSGSQEIDFASAEWTMAWTASEFDKAGVYLTGPNTPYIQLSLRKCIETMTNADGSELPRGEELDTAYRELREKMRSKHFSYLNRAMSWDEFTTHIANPLLSSSTLMQKRLATAHRAGELYQPAD